MQPIERLTKQAGSPARVDALNLKNTADEDGIVRGSILPVGTPQSKLNYVVAVVTLGAFVSWPYIVALLLFASLFSKSALACFVALMTTLAFPARLLWDRYTCSYILHCWQEYFNFSWIVEEMAPNDDPVIFAEFPHGAFPLGPMLAAGPCAIYFPRRKVYALAASAVFWLPIFKHLMTWLGCQPASRANLKMLLKKGSVAVTPGGIAEMFFSQETTEEVILRGRKGLIRTAIETGTPVVPCYHLGNSQTLTFGPSWLKPVSRRLRTSIGIVMGWMGTPLPVQIPIYMCVGKRIIPETLSCTPGDKGYEKEMSDACDMFTEKLAVAVKALYERNRVVIPGWEKRPLVVH
eukprot:jgi/Ulvmu1/4853/UM020_0139.1